MYDLALKANVKNVVVYCYYFPTALALGQVCEAYFIH